MDRKPAPAKQSAAAAIKHLHPGQIDSDKILSKRLPKAKKINGA